MIEQHSDSGDYTNRYKFNGKELDEETGFYYYGARYYNPKFSIWLSVDPLAEKFPNMSPYVYCNDNPINMIDPDGRAPSDWIKWITSDGQKHLTFDANVTTVQQAIDKGYTNVKNVAASGCFYNTKDVYENYTVDGNGNVTLSNGSSFNVHNGDTYITSDGTFINKNKTGTEQLLELGSVSGDVLVLIGLVTFQPELVALWGYIGNGSLVGDVANDLNNQGLNKKTALSNGSKIVVNRVFNSLSNSAVKATQKVAGEEFVETGANKVSESIIQGTVIMNERAASKIVDDQVKKVNQ